MRELAQLPTPAIASRILLMGASCSGDDRVGDGLAGQRSQIAIGDLEWVRVWFKCCPSDVRLRYVLGVLLAGGGPGLRFAGLRWPPPLRKGEGCAWARTRRRNGISSAHPAGAGQAARSGGRCRLVGTGR